MTRLMCLILMSITSMGLFAQDQTLFGSSQRKGVYISPFAEFYSKGNLATTNAGASISAVLDHWTVGLYAVAGADYDEIIDSEEIERLDLAHGGVELAFHTRPCRLLHPFLGTRVGWGVVNLDVQDDNLRASDIDEVWVIAPQLGLELNLTSYLRVYGYGSYRWVNGVDNTQAFTENDLEGYTWGIGLKLGWFGRNPCARNGCRD